MYLSTQVSAHRTGQQPQGPGFVGIPRYIVYIGTNREQVPVNVSKSKTGLLTCATLDLFGRDICCLSGHLTGTTDKDIHGSGGHHGHLDRNLGISTGTT